MTRRFGKERPFIEATVLSEIQDFVREKREKHDGGVVEVEGNHIAPEADSITWMHLALDLLGQFDGSVAGGTLSV